MSIFKDFLRNEESLFRDPLVLDYDYLPKLLPYRENEQREFALAIKPLFSGMNGRNLFVYGGPGIGKTTACRYVLKELEETSDEIYPIYLNCWKNNTTFKICQEIAQLLDIKFITNLRSNELFERIKKIINKKSAVFVFDEVDKLNEIDFLYLVLEEIHRKSIFLITNQKERFFSFEERIKSRFSPQFLYFRPYNKEETAGILKERLKYAFYENVWDEEALNLVVKKTAEIGDIRTGLYLMREAGNLAENKARRKISPEIVNEVLEKVKEFSVNDEEQLEPELKTLLSFIKENEGMRIGQLFEKFQGKGHSMSYKTFQRKISKLEKGRFISTKRINQKGQTTLVYFSGG